MTNPAKVLTNRLNSINSSGPKTPRGKSLSRFNAVKHGGYARECLPGERPEQIKKLLDDLVRECRPRGRLEHFHLEQICRCVLRLERIEAAEHTYLEGLVYGRANRMHLLGEASGTGTSHPPKVFLEDVDETIAAYISSDIKLCAFEEARERTSNRMARHWESFQSLSETRGDAERIARLGASEDVALKQNSDVHAAEAITPFTSFREGSARKRRKKFPVG